MAKTELKATLQGAAQNVRTVIIVRLPPNSFFHCFHLFLRGFKNLHHLITQGIHSGLVPRILFSWDEDLALAKEEKFGLCCLHQIASSATRVDRIHNHARSKGSRRGATTARAAAGRDRRGDFNGSSGLFYSLFNEGERAAAASIQCPLLMVQSEEEKGRGRTSATRPGQRYRMLRKGAMC